MARKPKEYEVERIVKAKVSYKKNRMIQWRYLVKWKGYTDKSNTWEPIESFEDSPKLIEKFWNKVDIGERDPNKAKDFNLKEEVVPRDETWSDADAEEGDEQKGEEGSASASPKNIGKKRRASASASESSPKRMRGRPSKAKKDAKNTVAEKEQTDGAAEGTDKGETAIENGEGEGEGEGGSENRRGSRRLSEQINGVKPTNDARFAKLVRPLPSEDLSSDDDESCVSKESVRRQPVRKLPLKNRRKLYIESDEEDDIISIASSHDGSLFSGDEDDETRLKENETSLLFPNITKSIHVVEVSPTPEPEEVKKKTNRLGRPVKARVKMIDDPSIGKALEERVARIQARVQGASSHITISTGADVGTTYRPTLLTSEKGKLVSQRNNVAPVAPWKPSVPTRLVESEPLVTATGPPDESAISPTEPSETIEAGDESIAENASVKSVSVEAIEMDTSPDIAPSANIVGALVGPAGGSINSVPLPLPVAPPPTSEELIRLSGAHDSDDELPDFQVDEQPDDLSASQRSVATASDPRCNRASFSAETPAWKQSSMFNIPTPRTILERVVATSKFQPPPDPKPAKLVIPLRLTPSAIVPVTLKDIDTARHGPSFRTLLSSGRLDGPPGKLFPREVRELFRCVEKAGSSARAVPNDGCTDEQVSWFSKLVDELEQGALYVVEIEGNNFVLCSSGNSAARTRLFMTTSNSGLAKTVLIQHIPISNPSLFAACSKNAQNLELR